MQAATATAKRFHRSTAEQIEYWADVGRQTSEVIDPDVLLSLAAGLVRITVEPVKDKTLNPTEIFNALEHDRGEGALSQNITGSAVKYQVCETHPGYLEQIDAAGTVNIGQFSNGVFSPRKASDA